MAPPASPLPQPSAQGREAARGLAPHLHRASALLMRAVLTATVGSEMIPLLRPWFTYGTTLLGRRASGISAGFDASRRPAP